MSHENNPADLNNDVLNPGNKDLPGNSIAPYWLSAIIESAEDAIISKTLDGIITSWNKGAENIFGYTAEEITGKSISTIFPPDRYDEEPKIIEKIRKGERIEHFETVRLKKTGELVDLSLTISPIKDQRGEVIGVSKIAREITERKKAVKLLRESEERYRALIEATATTVWHANPEGGLTYVGDVWKNISGRRIEDVLKSGWLETVHPDDRAQTQEVWQHALKNKILYSAEFRVSRAAGEYRWIAASAVPIFNEDGSVREWIGVNIDIDDKKRAEAEREILLQQEQDMRQSAETANRLKDEFLATLSHELRTPLNAILGWVQMLRRQDADERIRENALATIERSARAQNQLIDDILDVSRIITGKLRLDVRAVDLANVIAAALETVQPAAESRNIRLQSLLDPRAGPISGDPDRLQQVIWNLLSNAIKFTPKGGRVQIRLERINSHVEIVVSDTGKGIAAEFLPFVFDRFRQSDGSMTRRHGGLGLGLAIVRQLVELHGGTVTVRSAGENQGAAFTIFLPLLPVRHEPESAIPRVHPAVRSLDAISELLPELSGLRILLVDDEADSRDLLRIVLSSSGAEVTTADSAADALEMLGHEKFDVLISDIGMPDEDGFSLIRKVRELPVEGNRQLPAIALTAYARAEDRIQALRSGFQLHIAKPVDHTELIAAVVNLTRR